MHQFPQRAIFASAVLIATLLMSACGGTSTKIVVNGGTSTSIPGTGVPGGNPPTAAPTAVGTAPPVVNPPTATAVPTLPPPPPGITPTATPIPPADGTATNFTHTSSNSNISGDYTILDNTQLNGNPNAMIQVTPVWGTGGIYVNHPIGVFYTSGKWAIYLQDKIAMPSGAIFNVQYQGSSGFVHYATASNSSGDYTLIDNPQTNGNANALVFVTPNWSANNNHVYNNHPLGVFYTSGKWAIFNQDIAAIPANMAFNIKVISSATSTAFTYRANASNSTYDYFVIDSASTNGSSGHNLIITANWTAGSGTYNNHNTGVFYVNGKWAIFNQDLAGVPANATFNILVTG